MKLNKKAIVFIVLCGLFAIFQNFLPTTTNTLVLYIAPELQRDEYRNNSDCGSAGLNLGDWDNKKLGRDKKNPLKTLQEAHRILDCLEHSSFLKDRWNSYNDIKILFLPGDYLGTPSTTWNNAFGKPLYIGAETLTNKPNFRGAFDFERGTKPPKGFITISKTNVNKAVNADITIEGLSFSNYLSQVILIKGVSNIKIRGNTFNKIGNSFWKYRPAKEESCGDNEKTDKDGYCGAVETYSAITVGNAGNIVIEGNTFTNLDSSRELPARLHALYLADNASQNIIRSNIFGPMGIDVIRIRNGSNDNVIDGNIFQNLGKQAAVSTWRDIELNALSNNIEALSVRTRILKNKVSNGYTFNQRQKSATADEKLEEPILGQGVEKNINDIINSRTGLYFNSTDCASEGIPNFQKNSFIEVPDELASSTNLKEIALNIFQLCKPSAAPFFTTVYSFSSGRITGAAIAGRGCIFQVSNCPNWGSVVRNPDYVAERNTPANTNPDPNKDFKSCMNRAESVYGSCMNRTANLYSFSGETISTASDKGPPSIKAMLFDDNGLLKQQGLYIQTDQPIE